MSSTLDQLRSHAIAASLFAPTSLRAALARLGFVQADPIRAPARAQDLILRHRVRGYRAGDLERRYPALEIEEDYLYAYGFVARPVARLMHPRRTARVEALERKVLAVVRRRGRVHPRELDEELGAGRVVNAWGGYSKATKRALERLHDAGMLRVSRRDGGVRVYEPVAGDSEPTSPAARLRGLVLATATVLAPASVITVRSIAARLRRRISGAPDHRRVVDDLVRTGELAAATVDGLTYVWPTTRRRPRPRGREVRILAPFDPVVWDRRRFEHLWQWSYRFEAYTPPAKRVRGYYAMPLLWGDRVIGWANATTTGGTLDVELGFVDRRPSDAAFRREADAEIARLEVFLRVA